MKKVLLILIAIVVVAGAGVYIVLLNNEKQQQDVKETTGRILDETKDAARKKAIEFLGISLQSYYQKTGTTPGSVQEFVNLGIASSVPNDPETNEPVYYEILDGQPEACVVYFYLSSGEKTQAFCAPQSN